VNASKIAFVIAAISAVLALAAAIEPGPEAVLMLDKSVPYTGAGEIQRSGYSGHGVTVAVIDTGVDPTHPDLGGPGDGKIIGGHNFVNGGEPPDDRNGHGTQVAGIIAANGAVTGIAPDAKILSYKVSDDGESVSSELIIRAIYSAVEDGADIINISLGVNKTNSRIDDAVNYAVKNGVFVAVAAGNDGPGLETIGSPGGNPNAVTVGATHNNITSSLVATFEVNGNQYQTIPMLGVEAVSEPILGEVRFGGYGREYDFETVNATDAILLVERGSDREGETVYFAEKEHNAADAGARAIVVYNNEPGWYFGDVSESVTIEGYAPRIPILSLSQKDGMEIKESLDERPEGRLNVFYNPDYVAFFSSRGPASPFYIKPDLVAPGTFVNSTHIGGAYNFSSGTSFAAPHVSGGAALLLERHPELRPHELKSLLATTATPVTDTYGSSFRTADAGSGRLNLANAFGAELIISPTFLIMTLSPAEPVRSENVTLSKIGGGTIQGVTLEIDSPDSVRTKHSLEGGTVSVSAEVTDAAFGDHEGVLRILHGGTEYRVPIIFRHVQAAVEIHDLQGRISFEILEPGDWKYAKISAVSKSTGETHTTSLTPKRDSAISVSEPGEYWIESVIDTGGETHYDYDTILVETAGGADAGLFSGYGTSERPIYIVLAIASAVSAAGVAYRRSGRRLA